MISDEVFTPPHPILKIGFKKKNIYTLFKIFWSISMRYFFFITSLYFVFSVEAITRAVFDLGSSEAKITVADVNTDTNQITKIWLQYCETVGLRKDLAVEGNGFLSKEAEERLLNTLKKMKANALQYNPEQWFGVGTSVFRLAKNGQEILDRIKLELDLTIHLIPQSEEGEIGFISAIAATGLQNEDVISWDSGAGSFQISNFNEGKIEFYGTEFGIVNAIDALLQIQGKSYAAGDTTNPVRMEEIKKVVTAIQQKLPELPNWLINKSKPVIAVGGISIFSIAEIALKKTTFSKKEIWEAIGKLCNKTDEELASFKVPPRAIVSGLIFLYSVMDHCKIDEVKYCRTNGSCEGILIIPKYWY